MRFEENVTTLIAIFLGILLFVLSLYSLYYDYTFNKPLVYVIIDLSILILSSIILGGSFNLRKRLTAYRVVAERAFDEVVYNRLKPILDEVAFGIVEMNEMKSRLERIEGKISFIEDFAKKEKLTPESTINFYFKTFIAMFFYFGTLVFMLQFTLPNLHFIAILLYIYWWLFFSYEYKIFHRIEALMMLAIPILLVPSSFILLRIFIGISMTMAIIFLTSALYAYYYFHYSKYLSELEYSEHPEQVESFKDRMKKQIEQIRKSLRFK